MCCEPGFVAFSLDGKALERRSTNSDYHNSKFKSQNQYPVSSASACVQKGGFLYSVIARTVFHADHTGRSQASFPHADELRLTIFQLRTMVPSGHPHHPRHLQFRRLNQKASRSMLEAVFKFSLPGAPSL
jgi:hypothetical protein